VGWGETVGEQRNRFMYSEETAVNALKDSLKGYLVLIESEWRSPCEAATWRVNPASANSRLQRVSQEVKAADLDLDLDPES
jgi:hypothetical protein